MMQLLFHPSQDISYAVNLLAKLGFDAAAPLAKLGYAVTFLAMLGYDAVTLLAKLRFDAVTILVVSSILK